MEVEIFGSVLCVGGGFFFRRFWFGFRVGVGRIYFEVLVFYSSGVFVFYFFFGWVLRGFF